MSELLTYFNGNELAAQVWQSKYAAPGERTPDDMHRRMARELSRVMSEIDPVFDEEFVFNLLRDFKYIVPQGSIMATLGVQGKVASLSNCFVIESPRDSYGGILKTDEELVQLMKRRGGVGVDISTLRPRGVAVKNAAGTSTGAASFMERFSSSTREVAQDGRRGALMLTISVKHPDAEEFVNMKRDRTKVTGANVSVLLTDDFMRKAQDDDDYIQVWPCDSILSAEEIEKAGREEYNTLIPLGGKYAKRIKAKELYDAIVYNAWDNAEPGQLFIDRLHDYSPDGVYDEYKTITTNPCCFAESCRVDVVTKSGIKDLREVTAQDEVWLEKEGKFAPTSGYFQVGKHPVSKVTFSNGDSLVITENHKLAKVRSIRSGTKVDKSDFDLVELRQLAVGDEIRVHTSPSGVFGELGSYEDGLILGWLSGDGCLSYKNEGDNFATMYLDFWPSDSTAIPVVEAAVRSLGITNKVLSHKNNGNNVMRIHSTRLTQYYTEKFESNIWRWKKGRNPILYKMSKEFVRGYLSSYFSADGSIQTNYESSNFNIQLGSIELPRLEQVQMLLAQFGIKSSIGLCKKAGLFKGGIGDYATKDLYRLSITGVENMTRFEEEIGFISEKKAGKLSDLVRYDHRYTKSATYTKIVSIEPAGEEMVGCIEVPNHHHFTANSIISGNSEIGMGSYDACRLIAINLFSYVIDPFTKKARFDHDLFSTHCGYMQIMGDAIVDLELEHIGKILSHIDKSPEPESIKHRERELWMKVMETASRGRRTGCGITALGDTIAALGLKYDSDEALRVTGDIMRTKFVAELEASAHLADMSRAFSGWSYQAEQDTNFSKMIKEEFPDLWRRISQSGRRNVSWSTIAPTGSLSILTQTSSGLEPMFMPFYTRRRKINPNDTFNRVDFVDQNGDQWMEYPVLEPKFKMWILMQGVEDPSVLSKDEVQHWFEKSPWYGSCAGDIDWERRVDMQAVCQRFISHSISSTINIPNSATKEDVERIYIRAWQKGLKGVTVYRDGCRSGVLVADAKKEQFVQHDAPKRPKELDADLYHVTAMGKRWTVCVGLLENKPYEVFATRGEFGIHGQSGKLVKIRKKQYGFFVDNNAVNTDITAYSTGEEAAVTRLISTSLRHGAKIDFVVDQLSSFDGPIVSFSKAIARTLKKYNTIQEELCTECGSTNIERSEGCLLCKKCGHSKCS